ncbi:MAG: peptidylprolyl isomerase [Pseudomonadota bacterium]|nr:peptidylprolyl isomerase [Pseudomonadota bacterium]
MKRRTIYTCCFIGLLTSGALAAEEQPAEEAPAGVPVPSGDTSIATVNDQAISLDLFRLFYNERLRQANTKDSPAAQNQLFNEFINIVVTAQDAEQKELNKQKNVELALDLQRLQLLSRLAIQAVAQGVEPSEEDLNKAYEQVYGGDKRTEYKARHILVKSEDEAKKVIGELEGGSDFSELAKTSSLGPTGKQGGDLGWFDSDQMVKPFTEAVATMTPGEYSKTPVQTQFGWHVILLEETREGEPPAFEDVKDELVVALQRDQLASYISGLREKANLQLNPDLIKTTDPVAPPSDTPETDKPE